MNYFEGDEFIRHSDKSGVEFGRIMVNPKNREKVCEWRTASNLDQCKIEPITSLRKDGVLLYDRELKLGEMVRSKDGLLSGEVINTSWTASVYLPQTKEVIPNVQAEELSPIWNWYPQNKVYYQGWLGTIEKVIWEVKLNFESAIYFRFINMENGRIESLSFDGRVSPYTKLRVPFKGQMKEFMKNDLEIDYPWDITEKAKGFTCPFAIFRFGLNKKESTKIIYSKPSKVYIKWIARISPEADTYPTSPGVLISPDSDKVLFGNQLYDVAGSFDASFLDWAKKHTYCQYTPKLEDRLLQPSQWENLLLQGNFEKKLEEEEELKKNMTKVRSLWNLTLGRMSSSKRLKEVPSGRISYSEERTAVVEVIRTQQAVEVLWENGDRTRVLSKDVQKSSPKYYPGDFPQFVMKRARTSLQESLTSLEMIGIALNLDPNEGLVKVRWTYIEGGALIQIEEKYESRFDLIPHERFGGIKIGLMVQASEDCMSEEFEFGMIDMILPNGKVCIKTNSGIMQLYPMEFSLFKPQDDSNLVRKDSSKCFPLPTKEKRSSVTKFFNNFRTLRNKFQPVPLDEFSGDAELHEKLADYLANSLPINMWAENAQDRIKMMIIGPKGTIFEDGMFEFHMFVPNSYPNRAPSIMQAGGMIKSPKIRGGLLKAVCTPFTEPAVDGISSWTKRCTVLDSIHSLFQTLFVSNPEYFDEAKPLLDCEFEKIAECNQELFLRILDFLTANLQIPSHEESSNWQNKIHSHCVAVAPRFVKRLEIWIDYPERASAPCPFFPLSDGYIKSLKERYTFLQNYVNSNNKTIITN